MSKLTAIFDKIIECLLPDITRMNSADEAYLREATDLADLERRMRDIQSPNYTKKFFYF